ncbi:MAG: PQQ-binding-like beta-propeller repeat protein [Acidobacteriota bacterium]
MDSAATTRCCSALALATVWLGLLAVVSAQVPTPPSPPVAKSRSGKILPLSPFPSRTHFTLALNNQLTAPPAYREGYGYFPIEGDRIVAYELTHGVQQWIASARPKWAPAIGGDLLFISQDDSVTALRTTDGSTAWTIPFPEKLTAAPVWERGRLFVLTASDVRALRPEDGTLVWRQAVSGTRAAPAIDAQRVYLSLDDGRVLALRLDTGVQIWERRLGGPPSEILSTDDRLFVGSTDNFLYCLETRDGSIAWRWRTGADVVSKPVADLDHVYFVSLDNVIRSLNRRNGVQQWKKPLPFRPAWPPLKAADTVVVAGISGSLRAFLLKDGAAAGEMVIDPASEIAAPLHAFTSTVALGPMIIVVTRSIAEGASIVAVSKAIEPTIAPITPLPGIIPITIPKQ